MTYHALPHASKPHKNKTPFLHTAHLLAWRDIKSRWTHGLFAVFCYFSFTSLCFLLYLSLTVPHTSSRLSSACRPDASFSLDGSSYDFRALSGFFAVTLGFGTLPFTQAKAIDVVWDVVVGRGGQALLAALSFRVFAKYVASEMYTAPVTLNTFRTVFLHGELSGSMDLLRLVRDFVKRQRLQSMWATVFMLASMGYVLAFPTLGSAMTGYSANLKAYVEDGAGEYVPFRSFRPLFYTVHDGDRVGLGRDFEVGAFDDGEEPLETPEKWLDRCRSYKRTEHEGEQCWMVAQITGYVLANGLNDPRPTSSSFRASAATLDTVLKPPTLNITAYYVPKSFLEAEYHWKEKDSPNVTEWITQLADASRTTLSSGPNTAWPLENIEAKGLCQPLKTYNWGFSLLQLILNIILLMLWALGLSTLYIRSHITMRKHGNEYVPKSYVAVCELADAVRERKGVEEEGLRNRGKDVSTSVEEEEEQLRKREVKGGEISLKDSSLANRQGDQKQGEWMFRLWLDGEKWWFALLAAATAGMGYCIGVKRFDIVFALVAPLCVLFAIVVGQAGRRSRCVLTLWTLVLFGAVPSGIVAVVKSTT